MRYAIGVKIYNKAEKTYEEGLATFDNAGGFPSKETIQDIQYYLDKKEVKTLIYDSAEEAEKASAKFTKNFRRDDVWHNIWKKSKYIITFYPIKIDNNKFPFLVEETKEKTKGRNTVFFI